MEGSSPLPQNTGSILHAFWGKKKIKIQVDVILKNHVFHVSLLGKLVFSVVKL